tara:strand:- start:307 stop:465 length:159 start_codon:yes stop_codon:yes gene_type:complete
MGKEVRITIVAPIECTDEQFEEWVKFEVGDIGSINIDNPLHEYSLEDTDVNI